MKNFLLSGILAVSIAGVSTNANAQGYIHNLPLKLETGDQFYSLSNNGTAAISWKGLNEITTLKTTGNTKTGTATMVLAIKDVPGILKIFAKSQKEDACTAKNHNYLTISESSDLKTFANSQKLSSEEDRNLSISLNPSTKYIKFDFSVPSNGTVISSWNVCGHEFNPVQISIPKSIDIQQEELKFQGLVGEVKDTVAVNYSNPQGELIGSVANTNFSVRKLTPAETSGSEGIAQFEISYLANEANCETTDFSVKDANNEANNDVIKLTATSTVIFVPNAPAAVKTLKLGKSFASVSWSKVEGDIKHYQVAIKAKGGEVVEQIFTTELNYNFEKLQRNTAYEVEVRAIATNENYSDATVIELVTNIDFGDQLLNNGFENWEGQGVTTEPLHWNSFGTATGDLSSMTKSQQVAPSDQVRPGTTGIYSAMIYSRRVAPFNIPANGNLTTGRINAGSISAADYANHNFTDPTDSDFHQIITEYPDSASVWVYYKPSNASSENLGARVSFILHGEKDNELVKEPAASQSPLISATASSNYTENGKWVRLSIPFEKAESNEFNTPKYMLTSLTTNKTPGADTGGADYIYVDDLVLIYKPTLTVEPLATTAYTEGDTFELPYTLTGSMSVSNIDAAANTVYAELSDNTGSFDNATIVSEAITTDESGVLDVKLPNKMISGNKYRIRVVTTNYPINSEADQDLAIEGSDVPNSLEQATKINCKLYPNPAKERFFLSNAEGAVYQIRNIANQTVMSATYTSAGVDVTNLTTGIYFIDIRMGSDVQQLKFIKE